MMHQPVVVPPQTVSVDGMRSTLDFRTSSGEMESIEVECWGIATLQPNGKYHCYARVGTVVAAIEITIRFVGDVLS